MVRQEFQNVCEMHSIRRQSGLFLAMNNSTGNLVPMDAGRDKHWCGVKQKVHLARDVVTCLATSCQSQMEEPESSIF